MFSYTLPVMPQDFANWKILLRFSFVTGLKLVVVKFKFFFIDSASMKWPLFVFLGLYSPKNCSILLKLPEVVLNKTNTVFRKSFKILNFGSNEKHPKFTVLTHFAAQVTVKKPKILLKSDFLPELPAKPYILRNIN